MPLAFFSDHKEALPKWHQCIDINIKGVLNGMVAVYDQMQVQGRGHIINISSVAGRIVFPAGAVYCGTKHFVHAVSEGMRAELHPHNIRVTTIAPGYVETDGVNKALHKGAAPDSFDHIPLRRPGHVHEIGDLAVYLASPAASWITGEIVCIDGGSRLSSNRAGLDPEELEREVLAIDETRKS